MTIMTLAQARENFFAAMETLRSSKVRSALTVLGIVIGVSSVISMAAIIQGLNKFVQDRVQALGSRTYFISRFPPGTTARWSATASSPPACWRTGGTSRRRTPARTSGILTRPGRSISSTTSAGQI